MRKSRIEKLPGFEAPLALILKDPAPIDTLRDMLLLVSFSVPLKDLRKRTPRERAHAELYAARCHLAASDNPVRVPPRPKWLGGFETKRGNTGSIWD